MFDVQKIFFDDYFCFSPQQFSLIYVKRLEIERGIVKDRSSAFIRATRPSPSPRGSSIKTGRASTRHYGNE